MGFSTCCVSRICILFVMVLAMVTGLSLWANPPETVNVHGSLVDSAGHPLTGARTFWIRFFDAETGGIQLGEIVTGTVEISSEGLFNLPMVLPPEALAAAELWYALGIDTDTPPDGTAQDDLFPERFRVHSVPFALEAGTAAQVDADRVGGGTVDNTEFGHLDGVTMPLQTAIDAKVDAAALADHTGNTSNPHTVTKEQGGLGNADNTADLDKPVSNATQSALNVKANLALLVAHATSDSNPHGVTKGQVGLGAADNTADLDKPVSTAVQVALSEKLPKVSEACIVVDVTSDAAVNGANLIAAYVAAKAMTPQGTPLSSSNRAVVLVPPGNYDLGSTALTLDTDYVDIVGLSSACEDQYIHCADNVLTQTADDVCVENLVLHYTGFLTTAFAYYPNVAWEDGVVHLGSPPATRIRNCEFRASTYSMRYPAEYAGSYEDCIAEGLYAFGGSSGIASGTFANCTAGYGAFGGDVASGTFTNCTGEEYAFAGSSGTANGMFTNCTGGHSSFGGRGGTASGTFMNCSGGTYAFAGFKATANGTFTCCTGGESAFGGGSGAAAGGKFYHCIGGPNSFTTNGSPAVLYCVRDGVAYP